MNKISQKPNIFIAIMFMLVSICLILTVLELRAIKKQIKELDEYQYEQSEQILNWAISKGLIKEKIENK